MGKTKIKEDAGGRQTKAAVAVFTRYYIQEFLTAGKIRHIANDPETAQRGTVCISHRISSGVVTPSKGAQLRLDKPGPPAGGFYWLFVQVRGDVSAWQAFPLPGLDRAFYRRVSLLARFYFSGLQL